MDLVDSEGRFLLSLASDTQASRINRLGVLVVTLFAVISPSRSSAAGQRAQFEATVARVVVDVIVTGSNGEFVDDLTVDDFEVFEDGTRQRVLSAQYVDWGSGVRFQTEDEAARNTSRGESLSLVEASSWSVTEASDSGSTALGAIVYVVDIPGLDPRRKARFVEAWEDVLNEADSSRPPRALFMIDRDYRVREVVPLTYDRTKLEAAVETLAAATVLLGDSLKFFLTQISNDGESAISQLQARAHEERSRAISSLRALTAFCESLESRPRRTALVWVSSGIVPRPRQLGARDEFAAMEDDPQIVDAQEELYRAANSANVSIYSVDPGRVIDRGMNAADVQRRETAPFPSSGPGISVPVLQTLAEPLRDASRATAGRAFIAWGNLTAALKRVELDTSRYYLVTFAPPRPDGDGEYHEVRVEVRRPGVQVRARRGYVAHPEVESWNRRVLAALSAPGLATGLPLTAEGYRSWSANGEAQLMLLLETETTQPDTDRTSPDGQGTLLELVAVVLNEDGDTLDEVRKPLVVAGEPRSPEAHSTQVLTYRQTWQLPAGRYEIRVAITDRARGRIGARLLEFALLTAAGNPWLVADPVVVSAGSDSGPLEPVVSNRVVHGASTGIYVEVNNGMSPVARARVSSKGSLDVPFETEADRQRGAGLQGDYPLHEARLELRGGVHSGTIGLPSLPPGAYSLILEVADESLGESREFEIGFRIVEDPRR